MDHQERFRAVLRRQIPDRIPFVARLDFWYHAAHSAGTLPAEWIGASIPEIEARLGMGQSARYRDFMRLSFDGVERAEQRDGDRLRTTLTHRGRAIRQAYERTPEQERYGMKGHLTEFFLKSAEDYDTFTAIWEQARWTFNPAGFEAFARQVGRQGLPMVILGLDPMHQIMIEYAGYDAVYFHLADFPDRVEALRRVMEQRFTEAWEAVARSSAELVMHGAHWSTDMTPAPLFRRHFLPYFQRFTAAMHQAGKQCAFHADADLSGLLAEVAATGMDVADCFACAPLVPLTLRQARQAWQDRIVTWGGIPSTLLMPEYPLAEFRDYLDLFLKETADRRAVIAGVSDNIMPGTEFERVREIAERLEDGAHGPAPDIDVQINNFGQRDDLL